MKSCLDPTFKYTNAASTDIRATFRRIKREQKEQAEAEAAAKAEQETKVQPIRVLRSRGLTLSGSS